MLVTIATIHYNTRKDAERWLGEGILPPLPSLVTIDGINGSNCTVICGTPASTRARDVSCTKRSRAPVLGMPRASMTSHQS